MRAAWYERTGPADEVLIVGELPDPEPGPEEVRVRLHAAGINPADVKRRAGTGDRAITDPRVIPGDDGAGIIDLVGSGVSPERLGDRVWVHSANHPSPFGTFAQHAVVPARNAIALPIHVPTEIGACLGVPALTAHRCVFADGPVDGRTLLITGGAGNVAHYAIQLAKHAGATVIATASTPPKQQAAKDAGADHVINYRQHDAPDQILQLARPGGVDRVPVSDGLLKGLAVAVDAAYLRGVRAPAAVAGLVADDLDRVLVGAHRSSLMPVCSRIAFRVPLGTLSGRAPTGVRNRALIAELLPIAGRLLRAGFRGGASTPASPWRCGRRATRGPLCSVRSDAAHRWRAASTPAFAASC